MSVRSLAVALLVGVACAPKLEPVGISYAGATTAPPASASAPPGAPPWRHGSSLAGLPKANARRFSSAGHLFGRYEADVFVNEVGRARYDAVAPDTTAPRGALVVQVLYEVAGGPGPVFAMERGDDGWTFTELDARLRVVREGKLSPCVECHAHVASQDHLFGLPAAAR